MLVEMTSLEEAHRCLRLVCKRFCSAVEKTYPMGTVRCLDEYRKACFRHMMFTERPYHSFWKDVPVDRQGRANLALSNTFPELADGFVEAVFPDGRRFDGDYRMCLLGYRAQYFTNARPIPDPSWWCAADLRHIIPIFATASFSLYAPGEQFLRCKLVLIRPKRRDAVFREALSLAWQARPLPPFTNGDYERTAASALPIHDEEV